MKTAMTKERDGYHNMFVQVPRVVWDAVCREADEKEESAARVVSRVLQKHYGISRDELPKRGRPGRRPKK